LSVAELRIAEGIMMKKIETATKELAKLNAELDNIRRIIRDKQE